MNINVSLTENTELSLIKDYYITSKGGTITFDWWIERCGDYFAYICEGVVNNQPIKITVERF